MKNSGFGLRLALVRVLAFLAASALVGCRVLTSGLPGSDATAPDRDAAVAGKDVAAIGLDGPVPAVDAGVPEGISGAPVLVGCSDGTREGFRNLSVWPNIAGCSGAFDQMGVVGTPDLPATCELQAGNSSPIPVGAGCSAADLCAPHWHVCRDGSDVARSSPTGDCEGCVGAGERRFFLVASGASPIGICSPDSRESNDLHGCGDLGEPESDGCAPLARRMGFADCLATNGVWSCGNDLDSLREAAVVTKPGPSLGGVLCCRD